MYTMVYELQDLIRSAVLGALPDLYSRILGRSVLGVVLLEGTRRILYNPCERLRIFNKKRKKAAGRNSEVLGTDTGVPLLSGFVYTHGQTHGT